MHRVSTVGACRQLGSWECRHAVAFILIVVFLLELVATRAMPGESVVPHPLAPPDHIILLEISLRHWVLFQALATIWAAALCLGLDPVPCPSLLVLGISECVLRIFWLVEGALLLVNAQTSGSCDQAQVTVLALVMGFGWLTVVSVAWSWFGRMVSFAGPRGRAGEHLAATRSFGRGAPGFVV